MTVPVPTEVDSSRLLPEGRSGSVRVDPPVSVETGFQLGPGWLLVVADASGRRFVVPSVDDPDRRRRARPGDGLAEALVRELADPSGMGGDLDVSVRRAAAGTGERAMGVDQTHESVVVGGSTVVKWTVVAEAGEQPAPAKLRRLDEAGFTAIPAPIATVTWRPHDSAPVLLASIDEYVADATDGWTWYVDLVRAAVRGDASLDAAVEPAAEIGRLAAAMHVALAGDVPELVGAEVTADGADAARAVLDEALRIVDGAEGERLNRRASAIAADLDAIAVAFPTPVIDVHGDFHVGQVLRAPTDDGWRYVFTDFDGNPVLALDERQQPQPAARDVAGMLASLDHVGRVVVKRTEGVDAYAVGQWAQAAERAFLAGYTGELDRVGRAELFDRRLVRGFRAEQECREFVYAARHLPHWRYVPDAALAAMYPEEVL